MGSAIRKLKKSLDNPPVIFVPYDITNITDIIGKNPIVITNEKMYRRVLEGAQAAIDRNQHGAKRL